MAFAILGAACRRRGRSFFRKYRHQPHLFPSQRYTQHLVNEAIRRHAIFVIMRGARIWHSLIPALSSHSAIAYLRNVQNPSISSGNCPEAFERIVTAIAE